MHQDSVDTQVLEPRASRLPFLDRLSHIVRLDFNVSTLNYERNQ
jgi:hypothetical protein